MFTAENNKQPIFSHAEPVLAVEDITTTIRYWQDVLGFPSKWTWDDPPTHGGVSWQNVFIQFTQNPQLAAASKGNSIWIRLQHIESLYNFHLENKAAIIYPLENQPYGMAQYTIREINGYFVHFAGNMVNREKSATALPQTVRTTARTPTIKEYRYLQASVGWTPFADDTMVEKILAAAVFAIVAEDTATGEVTGCALLLGDDVSFYYVKDVIVHKSWQGRQVGTALMQGLTNWLDKHGANNALVGLFANESLDPFYKQFGFAQTFGMHRYIHRNEENR